LESDSSQRMSESSTNFEPKGKKETIKRKRSGSTNEHIEVNAEVADCADGAKTDSQDLADSLKQGFAQMWQLKAKLNLSKRSGQNLTGKMRTYMAEDELEEIPHAADEHHAVIREPPGRYKTQVKDHCFTNTQNILDNCKN